jgi:hypothetical protein
MPKQVAMSEKPDMVHTDAGHDHLTPSGTRMTDGDKGSSRYADSESGLTHKAELARAERKLLIKLGESSVTASSGCTDD